MSKCDRPTNLNKQRPSLCALWVPSPTEINYLAAGPLKSSVSGPFFYKDIIFQLSLSCYIKGCMNQDFKFLFVLTSYTSRCHLNNCIYFQGLALPGAMGVLDDLDLELIINAR